MAAMEAVKEAIWLKGFVAELSLVQLESILKFDSQGAIHFIKIKDFMSVPNTLMSDSILFECCRNGRYQG